jgi:hypothetical protein
MAAKRYHHSKSHKKHEDKRVLMGKHSEMYVGYDPARKQEMEDGSMIREDHNAVANLPQHVIYHAWRNEPAYMHYHLDDTIRGIDKQIDTDEMDARRHFQKGKY